MVSEWIHYCSLSNSEFRVAVFASKSDICSARTIADEDVVILDVDNMNVIVPNLAWLVPMAKDAILQKNIIAQVHYF